MTFNTYQGDWTSKEANHLLRRTVFGHNRQALAKVLEVGMETTIANLLVDIPPPLPPVNYDYDNDPEVPIGKTWINAGYSRINGLNGYRNRSLYSWTINEMLKPKISVIEKMVLFWHNHFVTSGIGDPRYKYLYIYTLQTHALGNFRDLTKAMTIDPAMLRYLNGNQNTRNNPNENYARELLELFTVGKGPIAGSGDYTTFTEHDVLEIAKVLTGWRDFGHNNVNRPDFGSMYVQNRHDTSTKKLSHRFDEAVIPNKNEEEYLYLIDLIFQKRACAEFLSRKLYRYFVYHEITDDIESGVIQPMADLLISNNYNLSPVLQALFTSEAFYSDEVIGCTLKHPLEFIADVTHRFEIDLQNRVNAETIFNLAIYQASRDLQMELYYPPSVAGWKAFYQAPAYSQIWINSTTLPLRKIIVDALTLDGKINNRSPLVRVNVLKVVDSLSNPYDINAMLSDLMEIMYAFPLSEDFIGILKELLIPGLPDFEWTVEYAAYRDDPDNTNVSKPIEDKLRALFNFMMNLPEYQLK